MATAAQIEPVEPTFPSNPIYIFADIETESVQGNILLQLAAVTLTGEQFNIFINPCTTLPEACTNFLGLYFENGALYRNGKILPSYNIFLALNHFIDWLSQFKQPIILVFHNGFSFDCYVLAKFLTKFHLSLPSNILVSDTLPYFRQYLKPPLVPNHKLTTLSDHFKIAHEHAHDALSDSLALKGICQQIVVENNIDFEEIFKISFRNFSEYTNYYLTGKPIVPFKRKNRKRSKKPKIEIQQQVASK